MSTILNPLHSDGYQFWSGIGSDLAYLSIGAVVYRRHNCHESRCWRVAFRGHPDDTGHIVCRKHYHAAAEPQGSPITRRGWRFLP